ncbi:hypothetical protein DFP72DRAFT_271292 [Ephemerocybe angulata]|uniref:Secreted protein n=1 Tax=Ephemerocybe angulata TaxID=980116 RepID=A0A8H6H694_9AGAR|nr:hypothetical protein DFP72DRAFT_298227 [Tulosesus angulatus]KAF6756519.1 hypothetical protein DFP72DRAFT_271292 [Tulosesus angulatus]
MDHTALFVQWCSVHMVLCLSQLDRAANPVPGPRSKLHKIAASWQSFIFASSRSFTPFPFILENCGKFSHFHRRCAWETTSYLRPSTESLSY